LNAIIPISTKAFFFFGSIPQGGTNALKQLITLKPGHPVLCAGSPKSADVNAAPGRIALRPASAP
jgi:hypothetical protein